MKNIKSVLNQSEGERETEFSRMKYIFSIFDGMQFVYAYHHQAVLLIALKLPRNILFEYDFTWKHYDAIEMFISIKWRNIWYIRIKYFPDRIIFQITIVKK